MSASSDISSLFKQFGGRPDQYQEIAQADGNRDPLERWPSMAKVELVPTPPVVAPVPAESAAARLFGGAAPVVAALPEVTVAPVVAPEVQPVAAASTWSGESLQSLLAKLAQEGRQQEPEHVQVPVPAARGRAQLDHIHVVAVVSAKGGVGKSTLAANLAASLQKLGRAVLAVDLDPQNALHHHFSPVDGQERPAPAAGIAHQEGDWRNLGLASSCGAYVLPYGLVDETERRAFEAQLESDPQWLAYQLSDLQLADGAVVIIDTPPGPSLYLQQALAVANVALVVSLSDAASYTALPLIDGLIKTYAAERADFLGAAYLINQVDSTRQLSKDITQIMQAQLGKQVVGVVHRDQSVTEALAYNRNVLDYDPHGRGCHDILNCAQVILGRLTATARHEQPA